MAPCLLHFSKRLRKKYNLETYSNPSKPAIFFGCYTDASLKLISAHKSTAVVIWSGSDAELVCSCNNYMVKLLRKPNIFHVAVSHWIEEDLQSVGLPYTPLKFTPTEAKTFPITTLGNCVYAYGINSRPDFYQKQLVVDVADVLQDTEFLTASSPDNNFEDMFYIYRRCFLGYRLTKHDGLSNTVLEMGQLGICTLHNNPNLPCTISWSSLKDISKSTLEMSEHIGKRDFDIAYATNDYLEHGKTEVLKLSTYLG